MDIVVRILVVIFCTAIGHGIVFAFGLDRKVAAMIEIAMTPDRLTAISWTFAGVIGLIGLAIWEYARSFLRLRLEEPRIEPQFDPVRDIHRNVDLFDALSQPLANKATYVQVQVVSAAHVDDCAGWLTEIARLDSTGKLIASLSTGGSRSLKWSPQEADRILSPIDPHIPQNLYIFRVVENVNQIEPMIVGGYPPAWAVFLNVPALYRITIVVAGKRTKPRAIKLRIDWKGQWNNFGVANAGVT